MADQTVKIQNDDVAAVAYQMARDIWFSSDRESPDMETQAEFFMLVANCSQALSGVKAYLPKE